MNELLGKKHAPRLRNRDRRGSKMLEKQSPQLAFPQTKSFRQFLYTCSVTIKRSIGDQRECPGDSIRSSAPRGHIRSGLRPASQARTEPRFLRRRRRTKKAAVSKLRRARRANRPAIDACRGDSYKHEAIETRITALQSAITNLPIRQFHNQILSLDQAADWRFSDVVKA